MNFLNPLYLIGALAAAVPILLHLIRREHARKMEFPTLMFLRKISKKTIRYQKLRHLLLLLLRVLALLLIALAFARPYFEARRPPAALGAGAAAHVVLIDNSMSMGFDDRWQRARAAAEAIVRNSGPGDRFAVLCFSDRTAVATPALTDSSEALSSIRGATELTDRPTRYGQALRAAEKFALDAGTGKRIVHLISDFQRSGYAAEEQDFRLSAGIELRPVDVGSDSGGNLAVRDVRVSEKSGGGGLILKASPVNFGVRDRKNVRVSLTVDGRGIAEQRVDLPKGSSQGIEFQVPGLIAGTHPAFIEIEDAELERDNRFHLTLENRARTPVLAVEEPEPGTRRSPSFFLSYALNIDALSPYRLSVVAPRNLAIAGRLIVWNNAPSGPSSLQKKLREFVHSGGGLAIVLADSTKSADFNRGFGSWLPVKAVETPGLTNDYVLMTGVRMDHPIFQPFSKPHSGNFFNARFYRYAKLTVGPGVEVPARFENGDPALATLSVGEGRVLIFTSSADDASNDLYLKAVYAPLWQQALRYLEKFQEKRRWLAVGDTASPRKLMTEAAMLQSNESFNANEAFVVLDPDKQRLPLAPGSDAVEMDKAGFYEIRATDLSRIVAVNTDPRESDLTRGNVEEMIAGWKSREAARPFPTGRVVPEEQDRRQRLWRLLLLAAALLLLSELLLSNFRLAADDSRSKSPSGIQSSIVN